MTRSRVAAVALAALLVFTTMQLTSGLISVVTTRGASMQPTYAQGDLVVTHRSQSYEVGDIIAYRSDELDDEVVLHRIIDDTAGRFITQGDNNDWVDADRPTEADIVGEAWFHLPDAGRFIAPIRRLGPAAAILAGLLIALALSSRSSPDSQTSPRRRSTRVPSSLTTILLTRNATTWLLAGTAVFGALAFAGYRDSTTVMSVEPAQITHLGAFEYEAPTKRSIVYPDASIDTGDPIFRSATGSLAIRYDHQIELPAGMGVTDGSLAADVVVRVGSWDHRLGSTDPVDVVNGRASLETNIDLAKVDRAVKEYRSVSGADALQIVVAVEPSFTGTAAVGEKKITFDTSLGLIVTADEVTVATDQLNIDGATPMELSSRRDRIIELGGQTVPAAHARTVGTAGVVVMLALIAATALLRRRAPATAPIVAAARGRLVEVAPPLQITGSVEVLDAHAFGRIAEEFEGSILHCVDEPGLETFLIDDGRVRYRYCTTPAMRARHLANNTSPQLVGLNEGDHRSDATSAAS